MPADSERIEDGLSRRQVLARGAVAAGVIWAAPVIRTATAYATSAAGTERPCINFYLMCCDALGMRPVRFGPDGPGYDDISAEAAASVSTTTSTSTSSTTSTSTSTTTTTTTAPPAPAATPAPSSTSTTSTSTTTTTNPPATGSAGSGGATGAGASGTDTTTTTTTTPAPSPVPSAPSPDGFGLFSDPTVPDPTAAAAAAAAAVPVDPHITLFDAALAAKTAGTPDNIPPGIKSWLDQNPDVPVRYPTDVPMLTESGDDAWAVTLIEVGGPDPLTHQCRVVKGWAQSKGAYAEFYLDPDPSQQSEFGRRAIFPNPRGNELANDPSALIESIVFIFCCPQ